MWTVFTIKTNKHRIGNEVDKTTIFTEQPNLPRFLLKTFLVTVIQNRILL